MPDKVESGKQRDAVMANVAAFLFGVLVGVIICIVVFWLM